MVNKSKGGRQTTQTLLRSCPQTVTSLLCDIPLHSESTSTPPQAPVDPSALELELLAEMYKEIVDIFKMDLSERLVRIYLRLSLSCKQ